MSDFGDWIAAVVTPRGRKGSALPSPAMPQGAAPDGDGARPLPMSAEGGPEDGPATPSGADQGTRGKGAPGNGPRNPWTPAGDAPPRRTPSIEDIFRPRKGGGPGGLPPGGPGQFFRLPPRVDGKSWLPLIAGGILAVWLLTSSSHQLGSTQEGLVTTLGRYSRSIGPGMNFTLPWPIEEVQVADVTTIRRIPVPDSDAENLMLTSDQSMVDLSYIVRWNIKDLKLYSYQLENPDATVREVAEAAMRASVAEVELRDVMGGTGRAQIEANVRSRMQQVLDAYHSGVLIQGVDIKKADPPSQVNDAFQKVSAARQDANRDISNAQAYAEKLVAGAEGEATAFDKVYAQYKLSPEVTRRRMYYETMEKVLSNNDKVIVPSSTTSYLPLPMPHQRAPDAQPAGGQ